MAIDMQAESTMINSRVFKIFLLLYLATRGLTIIDNQRNFISSSSLQCTNSSLNNTETEDLEYYTLELSSNNITWKITEYVECNQECCYSIQIQTACSNLEGNENCNLENFTCCLSPRPQNSIPESMIALITSVVILVVLLGLVTVCWIGTYRAMKKKMQALQNAMTVTPTATSNSLTTNTNNEETPNQQQMLCFQNASYEHNSPSFSQSPAPECPETNIYDLPFQIPTGASKETPKSQEPVPLPKGSIRYKAQETLPKGSLRYTANKPRSVLPRESENACQPFSTPPESPRVKEIVKEIEFSCSINEQQWTAVNEYEVPITQQEAQNN